MKLKTNFLIDLLIFMAFLVSANPALTGNTIHEWLGLAFGAAILVHLLLHWNWLVDVLRRFFRNFFQRSRLQFVVDLLFFLAMTASGFSVLLISKAVLPFVGLQLDGGRTWVSLHRLASDAAVLLFGLHFALHWKWIVCTLRRFLFTPPGNLFHRRSQVVSVSLQAVPVEDETTVQDLTNGGRQ